MGRWRHSTIHPSPHAPAQVAEAVVGDTPDPLVGNQPCSALRCSSLRGRRCSYVDRRGRRCQTAWCPADRAVVNGQVYCALHARAMEGLEWEFGTASHPDLESRTVPVIQWISSAVADEVIATLNVVCALHGEVLVAEPVRRHFNPMSRSRAWEKQWKTLSPTSVSLRVSVAADEARPTEIHIQVNGHDVNVVPPPWNRDLSTPTAGDYQWLDQEVLTPISAGVKSWMIRVAAESELGYVPSHNRTRDVDASVVARAAEGGAGLASRLSSMDADEAALDEVRRAHFLYGLEEIQAVAQRGSRQGA
jgi:hypothetical protein